MRVIKKLNNCVALCIDKDHNELIAVGTGIGFGKIPYELKDLSIIQRTYYNVDQKYLQLLQCIDYDVIDVATKIVDYAKRRIPYELSSNVIFSLADHIQFALQRHQQGYMMNFMLTDDLKQLYKKECDIGAYALIIIQKQLKATLPDDEKYAIALHFINYETTNTKGQKADHKILDDITQIIESEFHIEIDKDGFNYARFITHIRYLMKRIVEKETLKTENSILYEEMVANFPKTNACVQKLCTYLEKKMNCQLESEEILYLMLHVNRLCMREGKSV